ncbi:MAG: RimK family alpha-L-glutamate ligase, partial [Clostridia bacterium]|nr:RimK family alpha-L-glutamate ligase [Clostridia bacterium]
PYTQRESELYQPKRLKEELEKLGANVQIKRNILPAGLADGKVVSEQFGDFCVYLDKDRYAGALLEKTGLRLFNSAAAVAVCDDKMATFAALAGEGIPFPDSYFAPLCYSDEPVSDELLDGVAARLGYPLVVKTCYGSLGQGVFLVENREQLFALARKLQSVPHLFQKFVASSKGRDVRVIVIGGEARVAMLRTSNGDFRSNIELGGNGEPYAIDAALKAVSEKVARVLKLDYCGIDLLFDGAGGYTVCEVNSNAFFGGMERVTGYPVAAEYAKYIVKVIYD